jgi:hypothetical protein
MSDRVKEGRDSIYLIPVKQIPINETPNEFLSVSLSPFAQFFKSGGPIFRHVLIHR